MSLCRFRTGHDSHYVKARIFERGSRRGVCRCCGRKKFGVLVRFVEPKAIKGDQIICDECIVRIATGEQIKIEGRECLFGIHAINPRRGKKPGPKAKPGRKPGKKVRTVPLCKRCGQRHWQFQPCPQNENEPETSSQEQTSQTFASVVSAVQEQLREDDSSLTSENPSVIEEAGQLQPVIDAD
jgi:hypothetical protein